MTLVHHFLHWLSNRLTLDDLPAPADLIFVFAGKMERKAYGLGLYRSGIAGRLLLSVGRFEVSKMQALRLPFFGELISKRDATPPDQRHFFCELDGQGTHIRIPRLQVWNTYGEALGLRDYLAATPTKRVIVVSTDIHLRRIALIFRKVFRGSGIVFLYCPVSQAQTSVAKGRWWTRREGRRYVISETVKLIVYRAIFLLPESVIRSLMMLRN